ncbi:MAG: hypothetical protein GXP45_05660 [bacterium]|nr:hypothetical protein [bacterium]
MADHTIDAMYYDVLNFYNQNTEDYKRQLRTQGKQAIISSMQSLNPNIDKSVNETRFVEVKDEEKKGNILHAYE